MLPRRGVMQAILFTLVHFNFFQSAQSSKAFLEFLKQNYDKTMRPGEEEGTSTDILLDVFFESFGKIEEVDMEVDLYLYLRQRWTDKRLANLVNRTIILNREDINKIWRPDTYCSNAREADLMLEDRKLHSSLKISPDGSIFYTRNTHIVGACMMNLHDFPMDVQNCSITLGSCNFSTLIAMFQMQRRLGYFLIQLYFPCIFLVMLSWVVFWMSPENSGDRLTVGITTILTIVFLLGYVNAVLPKVSYAKGVDWYLMTSFVFVFLSLVECVVVERLYNKKEPNEEEKEKKNDSTAEVTQVEKTSEIQESPPISLTNFKMAMEATTPAAAPDPDAPLADPRRCSRLGGRRSLCRGHSPAYKVDMFCRLSFPLVYLIYNVGYWFVYLNGIKIMT